MYVVLTLYRKTTVCFFIQLTVIFLRDWYVVWHVYKRKHRLLLFYVEQFHGFTWHSMFSVKFITS